MIKSIYPIIIIFLLTSTIIISGVQAVPQISVQTDSSSYTLGDTVLISFSITNVKSEVNVNVQLKIVYPDGMINYMYIDVTSDDGGNAGGTFNFPLQPDTYTGIYEVSASIPSEGIVSNVVQFKVAPGVQAVPLITVQTDRSSYTLGDTVLTSFSIVNLPPTMSLEIKIEYTTPTGPFVSARFVTSDAGGNAGGTDGFVLQPDASPGSYSVSASIPTEGVVSNVAPFTVDAGLAFDFTIQLSPTSVTVDPGETGNFKVFLTYSDPSHAEMITFQVTGLGPGMNYQLSESVQAFDLRISTSSTTPPGTYPITVIGSGPGKTHQTSGTIIVITEEVPTQTPSPDTTQTPTTETPADFSISISPNDRSVFRGEDPAVFIVSINNLGEFDQQVTLQVLGLPSDTVPRLSTTSGKVPFSTTLTIDTVNSTVPGTYPVTIDASGGGTIHSTTINLTIKEKLQPSTTHTTTEQVMTESESNITTALSNPLLLAIIGIIGGAAATIVALKRRGRSPSPRAPRKPTVYCINCRESIRANAKHCPHCGEAQK
jgi:Tfp pilus assembly protein PilZ